MQPSRRGHPSPHEDPLYEQAVRIVFEERLASIALVQRRLRLGYGRTVAMFETMKAQGLVSSFLGPDGFRQLLLSPFRRRQMLQQLRHLDGSHD